MELNQHRIYVLQPFRPDFADVFDAIKEAAILAETYLKKQLVINRGDAGFGRAAVDELKHGISDADLIIADISFSNPNVLFELGLADGLGKPAILLNQIDLQIPFDVAKHRVLLYDRNQLKRDLIPQLADTITIALREPEEFANSASGPTKPKAFVSYSHADISCLKRMMIHLKPLEKQSLLDIWQDTRIQAGDKWKEQINAALEEAAIAVLLVSADFLASDFIVDNELPPLLAAAEERGTRILPVILKPCRFTRDRHLSAFQAMNNPAQPLLTLSEVEQEAVWDRLALAIENEVASYMPQSP